MRRGGTADLPLHSGLVPTWLRERMSRLGAAITEAVVTEYGRGAFLARLSDPFWFQALGCVMGMDWHSSGITTSVMGALKRGLTPISRRLGITVCGGRGRHSRRTPEELRGLGMVTGLDAESLVRASRLSAKVDNACVQDGFGIYLHCFVVSDDGEWAVVQQGMNGSTGMARRYHWYSANLDSFVRNPQAAIVGANQGNITNLSDARAQSSQEAILGFLRQRPERQMSELRRLLLPRRHDVRPMDVDGARLGAALALAYEADLREFADALLVPGVGPRTLLALALVAEVIHGAPHRFSDPARFAFAHGGKDGQPFPVLTRVYDESIEVLRRALERARVGKAERAEGLRKLVELARAVEMRADPRTDLRAVVRKERREAFRHGGRTATPAAPSARADIHRDPEWRQPDLFDAPSPAQRPRSGADEC